MSASGREFINRQRGTTRTFNQHPMPPDTRSAEEKAQDGVPKNWQERGRYDGGVGKPLIP